MKLVNIHTIVFALLFFLKSFSPVALRAQPMTLQQCTEARERIARVKQMHRLLYRDGLALEAARSAIEALRDGQSGPEADADVQLLLDFLAASTRGIAR